MADPKETLDFSIDSSPGDDRARVVDQLFQEHNRALVSFLRARLRNEQEARDVAQEAYVKLLQLDERKAVSFLRSYLFRIAGNLAIDRLRQRSVREQVQPAELLEAIADERAPERIAMATQELALVRDVLLELPDKQRQAVVLYVFAGASTLQIAGRLGLTDRSIRLYIAQGLALCRSRLDASRGERPRGAL